MNDLEIITRMKKYFDIREFVGVEVAEKYGNEAWKFLDIRLLHSMLIVREGIGKRIFSNNWFYAKLGEPIFDERGLRANVQDTLKTKTREGKLYLSGHVLGKALDFDVEGMSPHDVRQWIINNKDLFPFKIRLEFKKISTGKEITWVHLDVIQDPDKPKIYLFNV